MRGYFKASYYCRRILNFGYVTTIHLIYAFSNFSSIRLEGAAVTILQMLYFTDE